MHVFKEDRFKSAISVQRKLKYKSMRKKFGKKDLAWLLSHSKTNLFFQNIP